MGTAQPSRILLGLEPSLAGKGRTMKLPLSSYQWGNDARELGRPELGIETESKVVSAQLGRLRDRGLVESVKRGTWRRSDLDGRPVPGALG